MTHITFLVQRELGTSVSLHTYHFWKRDSVDVDFCRWTDIFWKAMICYKVLYLSVFRREKHTYFWIYSNQLWLAEIFYTLWSVFCVLNSKLKFLNKRDTDRQTDSQAKRETQRKESQCLLTFKDIWSNSNWSILWSSFLQQKILKITKLLNLYTEKVS